MRRLGDLLPEAAAALGLDEELALARAITSWERLVAEHAPRASGLTHLIAVRPPELLVSAESPIVAQELRLRATDLLEAFAAAPGGRRLLDLRVQIRPGTPGSGPRGGAPAPG
jgi:hypothetical protein